MKFAMEKKQTKKTHETDELGKRLNHKIKEAEVVACVELAII